MEDGEHYLQPLSNSEYKELKGADAVAPVVKAKCADGYTIINPKKDSNWESMFSTFHTYHVTYSGPDLNDHVTWEEWFLPSTLDDDMTFSVSEDCSTCLDTDDLDYGDQTVYYMTGDSYGMYFFLFFVFLVFLLQFIIFMVLYIIYLLL